MKLTFWAIFGLLLVFILVPVMLLFKESVIGERPVAESELKLEIQKLLVNVPESDQASWEQEWLAKFTAEDKLAVYTLAAEDSGLADRLQLAGLDENGVEAKLQQLSQGERSTFEQALRLEIFNVKRAVFMFRLKPYIPAADFERLRSGKVETLTLEHYVTVFTTSYLWSSITRSLRIAFISMIFTVGVAFMFAYVVNRTTCRFKSFFNAMMLLPLVSPPVIMAFALVMLFGRNGVLTHGLLDQSLHLINATTTNIYGMQGIVLAQLLTYGPVAYVVLHSAMAQLDTRVEEAAENLGATRWDIFRKVTLPMSVPGLFQAGLIIFASCLQDFGNPRVIGGELTMIAGVMYDQMVAFQDTSIAAVLGVILLVPSLLAYVGGNAIISRRSYVSKEPTGLGYIAETPKPARRMLEGSCLAVSLFILLMYGTIIWGSFVKVWGLDNNLTLANYLGVTSGTASYMEAEPTDVIQLLWDSVKIMAVAGAVGGLLAVVTGYVLERAKSALIKVPGFIIMLTVALPGVVFGIGYILAFNNPFGVPALALTGTAWIIILLVIFTRIYGGVSPTQAILQKVDVSIEEAAISLGASRIYAFRRVVFPALRRPWLLGSLYIFVSGLVALSGVIFLQSAGHKLISIEIYLNAAAGRYGLACVQSTYLILIVLASQYIISHLEKRMDVERTMSLATA